MSFNFIKSGVLSESELQKIAQETQSYKDKKGKAGLMGKNGKESYYKEDTRLSDIYFPKLADAPRTYNIIQSLIIEEYAGSDLNIGNISEFQYVHYPVGGKFTWHSDIINRPDAEGRVRGLTFSLNLSEETDYTGGELQLKINKEKTVTLGKKRGSYLIFPSFMVHQVTVVESGVREAIVVWTKLTYQEIKIVKRKYADYVRNNVLQQS